MNRPRRMDVPPVQHLRTLTAGQARRTALLRAAPGTGCSRPERVQGPNAFRKEMAPHEPYPGNRHFAARNVLVREDRRDACPSSPGFVVVMS